ncbi:MAG: hypothetical protein KC468_32025, partial [Myxococcales bacterium]|nr:hypothetical protein [Myxococcales bacterium]
MQPGLEDTRANADALILGETLPADNRDHEPAAQATSPEARVHEGHSSPPSSREPPPTRVSPSSPYARPSSPSASRPPLL